jgi:small-conductance mechanosensitive channel
MNSPEKQTKPHNLDQHLDNFPVIPFLTMCYLYAALTSCAIKQTSDRLKQEPSRSQQAKQISQKPINSKEQQTEKLDQLFKLFNQECKSDQPSQEELKSIKISLQEFLDKIESQNPEAITHLPHCQ